MGRMRRLCEWLLRRRYPAAIVGIGLLLGVPSLWGGLQTDDFSIRTGILSCHREKDLAKGPWQPFTFLDGDLVRTRKMMDLGLMPWWTDPGCRLAFMRPLAALLFAVADSHSWPVGWLANRNALIVGLLGCLTLLAHDRWRRDRWRPGAFLAPAAFALGLLAKEEGVAVSGCLLAYAVFLDRGTRTQRFLSLVPCVLVGVGWLGAYRALGFGVWGSGLYVDPLGTPGAYAAHVARNGPLLLLGQWGFPASETSVLLSAAMLRLQWAWAVVFLGVVAVVLAPMVARDALARFWAAGMVLAVLPVCATFPHDRLLMLSSLGAAALLAQFLVNRLTGAHVSVHKAETTVASWGAEAKARVKADLGRPQTPRERIAATRPIPGTRLCVTTDGTSVQTTEGWRDAKLVSAYAFDEKGKKKDPVAYAATLHYAEDYGDLAWWLMEKKGASRAETLVWLGDGAPRIRNQQMILAPHAVAIVDFHHGSDRLWQVGRALHPREERAAKRWSQKWIRNLYNGKVQALIPELARHSARLGPPPPQSGEEDPSKVLADAHRYFGNNADRMAYARYRAMGYPIGSGIAESACRHLVGVRMKRTASMEWAEESAEAMLQLRCLSASDHWDEFWGLDKLWQIIHARAA